MNILMLTPYLPYPPNSGGQIRSYNLIKQLSKKHSITLCSLVKFEEDKKYINKLKPYCKEIYVFKRAEKPFTLKNILKTGFSTYPFVVIRNFSSEENSNLPLIIQKENFDLIHAETFYVSPHIPESLSLPIVLVDQTIEFQVYEHYVKNFKIPILRPLLYLDVLKLKHWEIFYWKKAAKVIAVSKRDADIMQQVLPKLNVEIVPNGVGEDLIENVPLHFNKNIVFMGNYSWLQNIEAANYLAKEVFPLIKNKIKEAKLSIVGQYTGKVKNLKSNDIEVIDLSIDDIKGVQKYFRESGVLVAPLYGPGGTRLKILAAMAAKLPVVTTKVGIAGIEATNGENVLIGQTSQELADLTVLLLKDKKKYTQIAQNARNFVEENFFYESIAKKLDKVYQDVVKKDA